MSLFEVLDEGFLTEVYEKLIREINRSKTDSKDHHFQKLAYNLMKIAVRSNFSSLFQKGTQNLEVLRPWVKAEGYRWIGDFLNTINSEYYPARNYYKKSYDYWKDTLINQKESLINLTGSALNLIRSLKMSHQSDLLKDAVEIYPQFLEQLSIEHQSSQWLEYALCMVDILPPSEIDQLVAKAEEIMQSEAAQRKREFDLNRWQLEFELATIQKDVTAVEDLYEELMTNQPRMDMGMDMGIIQKSGMVLSNQNAMRYIAITFANAFWKMNESAEALKFLDDRLDALHSSWNRCEKEGWTAGSAQKSLKLQELISICETYVEYELPNKCEKIRSLLVRDYEPDEEIHPIRRINLLTSLGWYSEELLSEKVSQVLSRAEEILSRNDLPLEPGKVSPMILMRISRQLAEVSMLKTIAERMESQENINEITQFEEQVDLLAQKQVAPMQHPGFGQEEKHMLPQKIHSHLMEGEIEKARPLIREYEDFLKENLQTQSSHAQQRMLLSIIQLYISVEDYQEAKRVLDELEPIPTDLEPMDPIHHFMPVNTQQIMQRRDLYARLALEIEVNSKLNTLNPEEILQAVPAEDSDFLYEIGIVFARNNAIKAAHDILLKTQSPDSLQHKIAFSRYHFLRSQIFREMGLKEEALIELDISRKTESKYQGYEITSNLVKYLEEYFLLGEREKSVEIIDRIFEFMMKDVSLSVMRTPIPKCLFKAKYEKSQHPEYYELQNFLKSIYKDHIQTFYQELLLPGKQPSTFQETISFLLLLIQVSKTTEAKQLAFTILKTLEPLLEEKTPALYKQQIQKTPELDQQSAWEKETLFMKIQKDSISIPSNLNIQEMITSTPYSPLATEKEKMGLYLYKFGLAYQQLSIIFRQLNLPVFEELCKYNFTTIIDSIWKGKTKSSPITLVSEIETNLKSHDYALAKAKIQTIIDTVDGSQITSWEQFSQYTRIFELIAQIAE